MRALATSRFGILVLAMLGIGFLAWTAGPHLPKVPTGVVPFYEEYNPPRQADLLSGRPGLCSYGPSWVECVPAGTKLLFCARSGDYLFGCKKLKNGVVVPDPARAFHASQINFVKAGIRFP